MQRILVILSILFLSVALTTGYVEHCIYSPGSCEPEAGPPAQCPYGSEISDQAAETCHGACRGGCRDGACGESSGPTEEETCGQKRDCQPKICRLRPQLIADGPNRVRILTPCHIEFRLIPLQFNDEARTGGSAPETPPPWGVHPCVATSVMRI